MIKTEPVISPGFLPTRPGFVNNSYYVRVRTGDEAKAFPLCYLLSDSTEKPTPTIYEIKLVMETESLIKEKEECQEMDSISQTHLKAVPEEESFSQIEATETGSLIQERDALGATKSLVKETFHYKESSLEEEANQIEAISLL
ncbi:unnamed protein product [Microthlaspi erraticum]|uniref:Uncharacterized protein n=1 Tax=Microthlaspi erraticum TaxID=1685480 RepID=A0A6D2K4B3_9BRAS|nr:unnamed protein product [Microthlaspi erraticum]CAA7051471.1 unnamed protein product [Microthlaspi erraticum]